MRRFSSLLAGGALFVATIGATATMSPLSGAADVAPTFAYSVMSGEGGCDLVKIDLVTAVVTDLSAAPTKSACVSDLAVAPDGTPWGIKAVIEDDTLYLAMLVKYSPTTGDVVQTIPIGFAEDEDPRLLYGGITFIGSTAYIQAKADTCANGNQICLFTVDTTTGVPTEIGGSGLDEAPLFGLATCGGLVTYVEGEGAAQYSTVNSANGIVTLGPDAPEEIYGYDCSGSFGYALSSIYDEEADEEFPALSTLDQTTGALTGTKTEITGAPAYFTLLALVPQQVPDDTTTSTSTTEPSTTTTSTTPPARTAATTIQPRFAG